MAGIGNESFTHLLSYFGRRTLKEISKRARTDNPSDEPKHPLLTYSTNPLSRIQTLRAISKSRIDNLFEDIESNGVRIGIIKTTKDRLYPHDVFSRLLDTSSLSGYELIDHPWGGHDPLVSIPELTVNSILRMQKRMLV